MKPELINTYPIEVCHLPDGLRVYFPSYGTQKTVKVVENCLKKIISQERIISQFI